MQNAAGFFPLNGFHHKESWPCAGQGWYWTRAAGVHLDVNSAQICSRLWTSGSAPRGLKEYCQLPPTCLLSSHYFRDTYDPLMRSKIRKCKHGILILPILPPCDTVLREQLKSASLHLLSSDNWIQSRFWVPGHCVFQQIGFVYGATASLCLEEAHPLCCAGDEMQWFHTANFI